MRMKRLAEVCSFHSMHAIILLICYVLFKNIKSGESGLWLYEDLENCQEVSMLKLKLI